jgi:heme oxygenase
LSKVYGIPAGMYASQVWGTVYLSEGSEFGSQLQKRHLCSLRRTWSEEQHNKLGGA